jgi:hypothetical protein
VQAETRTLTHLFQLDVRYLVPLYQRPYVWTRENQWEPLWDDITTVAEHVLTEGPSTHSPSHFLGAIVIQQQENPPGSPQQFIVIDGQQRLTTLQLMLTAAASVAQELEQADISELLRRFVYNTPLLASGDDRFKVWPTNANRAAFRAVMDPDGDGLEASDDPDNEIQEAFAYFRESIFDWATGEDVGPADARQRLAALRVTLSDLLRLVAIRLEDGDSPQVIFETLNARGTPLIALDLLKNAVFLAAASEGADTDQLYTNHWAQELDRDHWRQDRRAGRLFTKNGDLFLQYWLIAEVAEPVPVTELFETFRDSVLHRTSCPPMESLIPTLCRDAQIIRGFDDLPPGTPERRFFELLELLDTSTLLPIALVLYRSQTISPERRMRAMAILEDFLVRRMICGWTTKNYNRLAAGLISAIKDDVEHADAVIESRLAAETAPANRWPRDSDVREAVVEKDLYGQRRQDRLVVLLWRIEEQLRAEDAKAEHGLAPPTKLTLEHIMPQSWQAHWPIGDEEDAAVVREAHVHRLGNLTLTTGALNSSLSNGPWHAPDLAVDKRRALLDHSLLRLNTVVVKENPSAFDELAIDARGEWLASAILRVWPGPQADATTERGVAPPIVGTTVIKPATQQGRSTSPRRQVYAEFWSKLVAHVATERPDWQVRKQSPTNWLNFRSERFHPAYYAMSFAQGGRLRHELYIDLGSRQESEALFNRLLASRDQIEDRYGGSLHWEPLPTTQVCRIADYTPGKVVAAQEHDAYIEWFVRAGDRLRVALGE